MSLENAFQAKLIKELKVIFPGAIVTKLDANHIQGIPESALLSRKDERDVICIRYIS